MNIRNELKSALVHLGEHSGQFEALALEVYRFQFSHNSIYRQFCESLGKTPDKVQIIEKIPFLPIEFFKNHKIISGYHEPQMIFESSGTTSNTTSRHYVSDLPLYEILSQKTFENLYGALTDYHIFALLPSYLERNNSSLVYMVKNFIDHSYSPFAGFFMNNMEEMVHRMLDAAAEDNRKILLIGVSFGLLDLAENTNLCDKIRSISDKLIVMETGGMKGRRKEILREELHLTLSGAFGVKAIHSEYGMTELLSQAYATADGLFKPARSMKVLLRETNDPFTYLPHFSLGEKPDNVKHKTGGINVIDLANIDSCSFLETQDLGIFSSDYKQFQVVGRFDNSDIRGCNLMMG